MGVLSILEAIKQGGNWGRDFDIARGRGRFLSGLHLEERGGLGCPLAVSCLQHKAVMVVGYERRDPTFPLGAFLSQLPKGQHLLRGRLAQGYMGRVAGRGVGGVTSTG